MLLSRWLGAVSGRLRNVRKNVSGRSRRGAVRGHSLLTRAASWSTAPDGSVRSSEFTEVIETLEDRALLAAAAYVDNPSDFLITNDQGSAGLDNGDTVTWIGNPGDGGVDDIASLIFGVDAFDTVQGALDSGASPIHVGYGTFVENLTISSDVSVIGSGTANTTLDGNASGRVVTVNGGVTVSLSGVKITNGLAFEGGGVNNAGTLTIDECDIDTNTATSAGGGIFTTGILNVFDSQIQSNHALHGGGILGITAGNVTVERSVIANNTADTDGGGLYLYFASGTVRDTTFANNMAPGTGPGVPGGGAIKNDQNSSLVIERSTFTNNSSTDGGGIENYNSTLSVSNSTFHANIASGFGGAIHMVGGSVDLQSSTLAGNQAVFGGAVSQSGTLTATNSIFADNTGGGAPNISGTLVSGGNNLIDNAVGVTGTVGSDIVGLSALLGSLQNNGGLTQTMALLSGSPAIDAGNDAAAIAMGLITDQRGSSRFVDGDADMSSTVDIGAFELIPSTVLSGTLNGSGNLVVEGDPGVDKTLTVMFDPMTNDVILTSSSPITAGAGATQDGPNSIRIPLASITGQIQFNGTAADDDTLLVNYAFGGFFDVDVLFNGGTGPGGNDKLVVDGGTFTTAEHTFTTVLPAEHSGNIVYDTGLASVTISYTGLEPVDMTGSTITDLVFNLPVGSANDFRLEDDGNLTNGLNRIVSNGGTFETTLFVNPTGSLEINAGGLGDYFNLHQLDDGYYTLGAPITFNGGAGGDRMYVHTNASTTTIPTGGVSFVGSGNNDGFSILPGYVATTIAHSFTNSNDGSVNIDGSTISYDDMNVAVGIYDQLVATNRTFQFAAGSDTISFGDDPTANDNFSRISSSGSVTTDFKNPSATFVLNGGDGNDAITIGSFAGMDAQFVAAVTIDGEGDTDSITQNTAMTLGSGTSTGILSLTAEAIDLNAPINTTDGTADTVTLSGTDISINAAITADGNVSATATNNIDLTGGSITTTSDASVLAGNALTTDAAGTDITAVNASLGSGAAGIGTLANPIRLSVTTLVTDSNDLSDGDQFLVEADTLDIGAADLDAGTATITLVSGTFLTTATGSILSNTVVANGATLGGNGTVTGSVTAQSGGTVSPGPTTAVLNTGSLSMTAGANFNVEINGNVAGTGYDQLNVTGTVNLGGATLNATGIIPSLTGQTIVLINNNDVDPVVGTFAGLPEGETVFINGIGFKISYVGGTGNDVTLTQLIQVSVTVSPLGVFEDGTQRLVYTFHRNGILDPMVVNFGISGTALVGEDFTEPSSRILAGQSTGTIRFGYGDANYVLTVIPIADPKVELDETVILTVLPGASYVPSPPHIATGTIINDDSIQEVSVTVTPSSTAEDGAGKLTYTFARSGGSALQQSLPLTVNFAVGGGANDATFNTDYTVSGAKTFGASAGTVTFGAKNPLAKVVVDPTPDQVLEPNETVVLTLTADPAYNVVAPTSASGIITDDDFIPGVTLSIDNTTIAEAAGVATVTATLSGPSTQNVTVTLGLTGTATGGGTDYTASATTITILAGNTTGSITLTAQQDPTDEPDETIIVDITGVTNGTETGTQQVTTTILDDDAPAPTVTLSIDNTSIAEAAGVATVTATLSAPYASDVTVNLAFTGTAGGLDYGTSGTSILIMAGNTTGSITITASDDLLDELDETVIVDISSVINGTELGTQQVTTTILDDDAPPTVTLGIDNANIAETGGSATVTATLSAPSGQNVTVNLAFSGTALAGDYTASGTSITILAGATTGSISLTSTPDFTMEGNETIVVDIDTVTNGTELGMQQVMTTIVDDDFGTALTVTLSNSNNDIVVSQSGGNLFVKRGTMNLITPTPIASVSSLHIEGGSAVDKVTLHASLLGTFVGQFSFDGNSGNDSLNAQAIVGAGNFPTLFNGGLGNDVANGGAGNDTFIGGAGVDQLNGNAGNDSLDGGDDRDSLNGGDGNDTIHGGSSGTATQIDTIRGGNGDDLLYGDDGRDSILGEAGNDTILGGLGNDTVDGGTGNDGICGDEGDDSLKGGTGNDTILGEAGNDKLFGDAGADLLHGGDGNDTLTGGSDTDSDTLFGAAGTNSVTLKVNDIEAAFIFDCDDFFI